MSLERQCARTPQLPFAPNMVTASLRTGLLLRTRPAFHSFAPALTVKYAKRRAMATASAADWLKEDERRMLHAVYRVGDLDATMKFYEKHFGLKQTRYRDIPEEKYTNAFMAAGSEKSHFALELTYNYGVNSYDLGSGFGHFALAAEDITAIANSVKQEPLGGKVAREPGPVKGGKTVIAFVEDPTGYKWELIQRQPPIPEPIAQVLITAHGAHLRAQVMLRVTDLDASIQYYTEALGMRLLRKSDNESQKYSLAFMGYADEKESCVIELTYNWGVNKYDNFLSKGYAQTAISTKDVYKSAEQIKAAGGKITREAGPLPGLGTKILATTDPDGWKYVLVDNEDFLKELQEAGEA